MRQLPQLTHASFKSTGTQLTARTRTRGFTLVELMVTIAVLAIVLAIGVPSFAGMTNRNRLTAAANELVGTLQTAKMEAIRRNARVVICPTANGTSCSGVDNWGRVRIFVYANSDGSIGTAETIVREADVVRAGTALTARLGAVSTVRFGADGRARIGNTVTPGAISIVSSKLPTNAATRRVQLAAGRISVCNPSGTPICN